jgi:carboxylesterase
MVHGFTGSPKEMRMMGEALHQRGLTVLGVRLTGHATRPEDMARTHWEDWLASVEDGIDLLSGSCDHLYYAGLSLGSVLSLIAAARIPPTGVIAMSTPFEVDGRVRYARIFKPFLPWIKKEGTHRTKPTCSGMWNTPNIPPVRWRSCTKRSRPCIVLWAAFVCRFYW